LLLSMGCIEVMGGIGIPQLHNGHRRRNDSLWVSMGTYGIVFSV